MKLKVNEQILTALSRPGGAYGEELATISPTYRDDIAAMLHLEIPIEFGVAPDGRKFAFVRPPVPSQAAPEPAASPMEALIPPSAAPHANAPPLPAPEAPAALEAPPEVRIEPEYDAHFTAADYRVRSRDGAMPQITMTAEGPVSAQAALLFSARRKRGEVVDVFVRVRRGRQQAKPNPKEAASLPRPAAAPTSLAAVAGIPDEEPITDLSSGLRSLPANILSNDVQRNEKGEAVPIYQYECRACKMIYEELQPLTAELAACPGCGGEGERLISAPGKEIIKGTEKDPMKKSRQQIAQEIDEQVRDNELPPALADAQAKLASL